jgi:iron(II)-dependent oxidoreductase
VGLVSDLADVRMRTLELVAPLPRTDLERQVHPLLSPLVWDLAHIAAYEDLWIAHRHGGRDLLHGELAAIYDAFETPRAVRGSIELLDHPGALAYLGETRARTLEVLEERPPDLGIAEMVLQHELQHTETMLQAMRLGSLPSPALTGPAPVDAPGDWIEMEGGDVLLGAAAVGFAYDNERPQYTATVAPFRIARCPVTNEEWRAWGEGRPTDGPDEAPVCHVSWHEADSFARASGARLPTEPEWEVAAAAGVLAGVGSVWEWTSTEFHGYPGFVAHPYPEYSEVFFGQGYRVLRGGSWATHPRVATTTFRNWDLPERHQIFAGLRLAEDIR